MDWIEQIETAARQKLWTTRRTATGIGIDFPDGNDVFWILPCEITSSYPVPAQGPDVAKVVAEFERIVAIRQPVVHVVAHYLASQRVKFNRWANGSWPIRAEGGLESAIDVGAWLTARARKRSDFYQLIREVFESQIVGKPPSRRRIDRYLALNGPPANEQGFDPEQEVEYPYRMRGIVQGMRLCGAIQDLDETDQRKRLDLDSIPLGRIEQALLRAADQLDEVHAALQLLDRTIELKFDDGEADFKIDPKARSFAESVAALGVEPAGDGLAAEFRRVNAERTAVLGAIRQAAVGRGWGINHYHRKHVWRLGRRKREVQVALGDELTVLLQSGSPVQALRESLASYPDFADACVSAFNNPDPPVELEMLDLPPNEPTSPVPLSNLTDSEIRKMDAFASRAIAKYLESKDAVREYGNDLMYRRGIDTWAGCEDWIAVAERALNMHWRPNAAVIFLDFGDPRGEPLAEQYLRERLSVYDRDSVEAKLAWRFRNRLPRVGRRWFRPERHESIPWAKERVSLRDPIATWYVSFPDRADNLAEPSSHQSLVDWARTAWGWSIRDRERLQEALRFGYTDVADALDDNPYLVNQMLTADRREELPDEPGIFFAGDFLLAWSLLKPTKLLGQLLATATQIDLIEVAASHNRRVMQENKKTRPGGSMDMRSIFESWYEQLSIRMAIAWKRYRAVHP